MWDNPGLLNALANLFYAVAAFILLCIAILSTLNSSLFPLRTLVVEGEIQHVDAQALSEAIAGKVQSNFFAVDLEAVRAALEQMPWVRRAHVRRQWPDRLQVTLEEHVAVARWGEKKDGDQLVNRYGEIFIGRSTAILPRFVGPLGSEMEVARHYVDFSQSLAPLHAAITQIDLSERSAWQLKIAMKDQPALTLMLGRSEADKQTVHQRLQRFVAYYPRVQSRLNRSLQYVDLRYLNGFAVRVPEIALKAGNV
ncbi:MAG TPA: FtsQ-type POTRA domain-containing protein [Burkholderiales bacterium]|nr:FtsQ-type POTRA domain-containing protein [Burkholderiales bacterium]